jgi:hypothetical protein
MRSRWEAWRNEITGKRIYRCPACSWRGWSADTGPTSMEGRRLAAERAQAPEPPNLKGTALSRDNSPPSKIDLELLDRVDAPGDV